jgi:hypothetical protein
MVTSRRSEPSHRFFCRDGNIERGVFHFECSQFLRDRAVSRFAASRRFLVNWSALSTRNVPPLQALVRSAIRLS